MTKKARKPVLHPGGARPTTNRGARYAAPSHDWPDLVTRRPDLQIRAQLAPRRAPQRLVRYGSPRRAVTRPKRPQTPLHGVFGGWELPPYLLTHQKAAKAALTCARRHSRRSTLFALRLTGAGAHSPKKHYTNRSCK